MAFTSIRSDYDLMSSLYRRLDDDDGVDFKLVVSGAHLVELYGYTISEIKKDGFDIAYRVETLLASDSKASRIKSAAILQSACVDIVDNEAPDLVIYAGDREDVLVYAVTCSFLNVPSVHFFGGDHARDGHVDNPVRHSTSKLSAVHFVSTDEHKKRLKAIGEQDFRIHVIGSVAIDKFVDEPFIRKRTVLDQLNLPGVSVDKHVAVLIFHPINSELGEGKEYIKNMVYVLTMRGYHVCASMPNSDAGNHEIREALIELEQSQCITLYNNLSRSLFVNLLRSSDLLIGNSSAGLLEAPSVPLPVINVGERQKGRWAADNVVFSGGSVQEIAKALDLVESAYFKEKINRTLNPYGDGKSVSRAHRLIKSLDFSGFVSKPEDPLHNDV